MNNTEEWIEYGTPISVDQAIYALLKMIKSPIVGDIDKDQMPSSSLHRIRDKCYDFLSGGEKKLVDIAQSIWMGPRPGGAHINALGGLDRINRRKVLLIMFYFYLGRDTPLDNLPANVFRLLHRDADE